MPVTARHHFLIFVTITLLGNITKRRLFAILSRLISVPHAIDALNAERFPRGQDEKASHIASWSSLLLCTVMVKRW
jgi:hypothetical protein